MATGLIGRKKGMTSIFDENGKNIPCTIIELGPCVVTQIKTDETDGYSSVQVGYDEKKEKIITQSKFNGYSEGFSIQQRTGLQLLEFKRQSQYFFLTPCQFFRSSAESF